MSEKPTQNTMHSNIEFKNLGKIKEANIQIRPFTVIAGCNSSGKSFITKSLYSLFSVIGGLTELSIESLVSDFTHELSEACSEAKGLSESISTRSDGELGVAIEKLSIDFASLKKIPLKEITSDRVAPLLGAISLSLEKIETLSKQESFSLVNGEKKALSYSMSDLLKIVSFWELRPILKDLLDYLSNPDQKTNDAINANLAESFRDNFTIPSTKQLIHFNSDKVMIRDDDFGLVNITDEVKADKDTLSRISTLNPHPPIYLESPIYWKLSDALEDSKKALDITARKRNLNENQLVSKVPKYFFDAIELLEDQVKTDEFNDIAEMIEEAIKGSLSINDGGIQFIDKGSNKAVSLSVTASGVTNLGMIALLLKRGAILPGTFLFIDEPEVHLHPMWQVVLVKVLHELSKRGVNIVIASHSIDIMKAIENIMNNDEDIDQQAHFGINQLTEDGYSVDITDNNFKRIAAIKEDLGKPFYDMFMGA